MPKGVYGRPSVLYRLFSGMSVSKDKCWVWSRAPGPSGYGSFRWRGNMRPYKVTYELLIGPVPRGLELDHLCRNKLCCNPDHLEPVTHKENILRGQSPAAINAKKTHCPSGHKYSKENTIVLFNSKKTKIRRCRTCAQAYQRKWSKKK